MSFKTNWEPDEVLPEITGIINKRGGHLKNIGEFVEHETDGRNGHKITAESVDGRFYNTRVKVNLKQHPTKGTIVEVKPGYKCSAQEAQEVEERIQKLYFNGINYPI